MRVEDGVLQAGEGASIWLPHIYAIEASPDGNPIQQVRVAGRTLRVPEDASIQPYGTGYVVEPLRGDTETILAIADGAVFPDSVTRILRIDERDKVPAGEAQWVRHPALGPAPGTASNDCVRQVIDSWSGAFSYTAEDTGKGIVGLRAPQIGAVHMIHGHWTTTDETATIVMPTGTGKTETMLSILVSAACLRLLVIVPTDALRGQLVAKFLTLGLLKDMRVVAESALYPIVGTLKHGLANADAVDAFFERCNVVVATAQVVSQSGDGAQERMAQHCPYLFIDEAHHAAATTWHSFREKFAGRRIVQFTATPFRNDRKVVGGKIIYNFRLKQALEQGYFRPIRFDPIAEVDQQAADVAIAAKAVAQLRADEQRGYDHILMARVDSVARAREVFALYQSYVEFAPVQIHSGLGAVERERVQRMILEHRTRIIVCVDMLGEGFDLPELKIAALHDAKKSLAITLQLVGRFTRAKPNLGNPTFIANIGDPTVSDELHTLYVQDANWNELLPQMSEEIVADQVSLRDFLDGFDAFPSDLPLHTIRPALSTVMYRTTCAVWHPEVFLDTLTRRDDLEWKCHGINEHEKTLVVVMARRVSLDWTALQDMTNREWDLLVIHWDEEQRLLFINSSGNKGYYRDVAQAVAGPAELINGPEVFRAFSGINRLMLQNVGLAEQLGRLIRYTMRAGPDVEMGLTEAQKRNVRKSNIFGTGYENGAPVSIGCSYKGRIWSWQRGHLRALIRWCEAMGKKVVDGTIDADQVLRGTLTPIRVTARPRMMPIGIDWPTVIDKEQETAWEFVINDAQSVPLYLAELRLVDPAEDGILTLALCTPDTTVTLTLLFEERAGTQDYRFEIESGPSVAIKRGKKQIPLDAFFYDNPPIIRFADGSSLEGASLTSLKASYAPYPADRIRTWDWTGVDITVESQGQAKNPASIQYRVIQTLQNDGYDVIVDDDAPGEAADVVAIRIEEQAIAVNLYHCKFSKEEKPGKRVKDLYEVCGQAQKSIHWMDKDKPSQLFGHLLRRDQNRLKAGQASRLEKGTKEDLLRITQLSRSRPVRISVSIVQPGLSRNRASREQLELLSVTENYLMETFRIPFTAIASA